MRELMVRACMCVALLSLMAGGADAAASSASAATMRVVLAWYPTPEYGGLYAAEAEHYFQKQGIDVRITPGGPQVSATALVGAGHADIGYSGNDEDLLEANENGIPLTEFATTYEIFPGAIEFHRSHPLPTLSQVDGKVLSAVTGSVDYEWLKHRYHLHNTITPFSYATFAHSPNSLLLGYAPNDVPTLAAQGIRIGYIPVAKSGLAPYADSLFAKSDYVRQNTGTIRRFLTALGQGWQYFYAHYRQVDTIIHKAEPTTPLGVDDEIAKMEIPFIYGGDSATRGIGAIRISRIRNTYQKLLQLKVLKHRLNINTIANVSLVPKLVTPPGRPEEVRKR